MENTKSVIRRIVVALLISFTIMPILIFWVEVFKKDNFIYVCPIVFNQMTSTQNGIDKKVALIMFPHEDYALCEVQVYKLKISN